jgi:hypothetical protein
VLIRVRPAFDSLLVFEFTRPQFHYFAEEFTFHHLKKMTKNRRTFMIATGMAVGGAIVGRLAASPLTSKTPEGEVNHIVSQYGCILKSSKDAKGVTHLRVKLSDHGKLLDVFSSQEIPFGTVQATRRNTLEFDHHGQKFSVSHAS